MDENRIRAYARLIARTGANVQAGQGAVIKTQVEGYPFARLVAEECYKAGAAWVQIDYMDQVLERLDYQHQKKSTLCRVPKYERERQRFFNRELPCEIYILLDDPDAMEGLDEELLSAVRAARRRIIKPLRDVRDNKNQWCIAAIPGEKWAKKVFPEMNVEDAMEALWEAILSATRVTDDAPEKQWDIHNENLHERSRRMSEYNFESVHLESESTGTDLRVGLIDGALWLGGAEKTDTGIIYNPNMPTEEVFTSPMAGKAEGVVYSTKPLSWMGQMIEDFSITFKGGKAVSCTAKKGGELLQKMIELDEYAGMLGEVAIIGIDSPIEQSGVLFYETLFDENASCHLALGAGFTNCLPDFAELSLAQCTARGINDSVHHTDFMIGAADMKITGTTRDGKEIVVFEDGLWKI